MTDILETINHFWPDTIRRYGINAEDFPEGCVPTPCCGGFVEIVENASLPSDADITSKLSDYNSYISDQQFNYSIIKQIEILEATQTPRRMREALANPIWLNTLNTQIATLRAQLK